MQTEPPAEAVVLQNPGFVVAGRTFGQCLTKARDFPKQDVVAVWVLLFFKPDFDTIL